jgi:hypothetical protein
MVYPVLSVLLAQLERPADPATSMAPIALAPVNGIDTMA